MLRVYSDHVESLREFFNHATSHAGLRLLQILHNHTHQQIHTHESLREVPVLPSTHPAPVLFPPAGKPVSAVGIFGLNPVQFIP